MCFLQAAATASVGHHDSEDEELTIRFNGFQRRQPPPTTTSAAAINGGLGASFEAATAKSTPTLMHFNETKTSIDSNNRLVGNAAIVRRTFHVNCLLSVHHNYCSNFVMQRCRNSSHDINRLNSHFTGSGLP
jgi:hypothetical protein